LTRGGRTGMIGQLLVPHRWIGCVLAACT
jgi:hypothetical protein